MIQVSEAFDGVDPAPGEVTHGAQGLERAARAALTHAGAERYNLSLAVVSDAVLASLHDRYLDDPTETDVMSFDLSENWGARRGRW